MQPQIILVQLIVAFPKESTEAMAFGPFLMVMFASFANVKISLYSLLFNSIKVYAYLDSLVQSQIVLVLNLCCLVLGVKGSQGFDHY